MKNNPKFRVYDTIDKKWLYGYEILGGFSLYGEVVLFGEIGNVLTERINDLAVMQYIGTFGKNKVDVYDGDIVKVRGRKRIGEYITKVIHMRQGFTLEQNDTLYNNDACFIAIIEVIGNIYQNPKLLP